MKLSLVLISSALLCSSVLGVPKCGKRRTLNAKYGRLGEFQSAEGIVSTCNYRIRASQGLHINLTFDNFQNDSSIFELSILKSNSKAVMKPLLITGEKGSYVAEFSSIVIKIKTSSAAEAVSIQYEAVIPADGNFGFDFRATKRARIISSPGFLRFKLPSNIHSVWNIHAKKGRAIALKITGFSTASDEDYLRVTDGNELIDQLSGKVTKKDMSIIRYSVSQKMVISLYTNTANSKGFRAKVFTANVSDVVPASVNSSSVIGLRCHKRKRITSEGKVVALDDPRVTTCSDDTLCGHTMLEVTSIEGNRPTKKVELTLGCIPREFCMGGCRSFSPEPLGPGDSCNVSCCSTDMCNSLPDGPKHPPGPGLPSFFRRPVSGGLRCIDESILQKRSGPTGFFGSNLNVCLKGSVCALYVFTGTSRDSEGEMVAGYSANCSSESECNEATCSSLRITRDVNIESCNVTCCKGIACNSPNQVSIPVLPTPEYSSDYCYDIQQKVHEDTHLMNIKSRVGCTAEEERCLRVDGALVDDQGRNVMASYGKCVTKSSCENIECSTMFGFANATEVTTCKARCCDTNFCNDYPLWLDPPTVPGTSLWCFSKYEIVREGVILVSDGPPNSMCNDDYVCALYKFHGTSTDDFQRGEPMAGYSAMCQLPSDCDESACQRFAASKDISAHNCSATCCSTNMCNEPGDTPMPSPSTAGLQCFDILQSEMSGAMEVNQKTQTSCRPDFSCMRIEAVSTTPEGKVHTVYGGCLPTVVCSTLDCSLMTSVAPGRKIEECRTHCCDTDLCNDQAIPTTTSPLTTSSLSGSPPSTTSSIMSTSSSTATGTSATCYQSMQMMAMGMVLPGTKKEKQSCPPGSKCFKMTAQASHSALSGIKVGVEYGSCAPASTCGVFGCNDVPIPQSTGVKIESCEIACCSGDLCNA